MTIKKLTLHALLILAGFSALPCNGMKNLITLNNLATFALGGIAFVGIHDTHHPLSTYIHELGHALTFKAFFDGRYEIRMYRSEANRLQNLASAQTVFYTNDTIEGISAALTSAAGPLAGMATDYLMAKAELFLLSLLPLSNNNPIKVGLKFAIIGATALLIMEQAGNFYPRPEYHDGENTIQANDGGKILEALSIYKNKMRLIAQQFNISKHKFTLH